MAFYNQKVKDGVQRELMMLCQNISLAISQPHNWGTEGEGVIVFPVNVRRQNELVNWWHYSGDHSGFNVNKL